MGFTDVDGNAVATDPVKSVLVLDTRLWARWDTRGGRTFYARVRELDLRFDMAPGNPNSSLLEEGLQLDMAYLDLPEGDLKFRLGRQYLRLGRGLTLDATLDAVAVDYATGQWSFRSFAGRTPTRVTDLDPSVGRGKRRYAAVGADYLTGGGHRLFGYLLDENDGTDVTLPGQALRYDAWYAAIGADGPLRSDLGYYVEAIREGGTSADAGSLTARSPIEAQAGLFELTFRPDRPHHPTVFANAAYGRGDADRGTVLGSAGGNRGGTDDNAFIGLGRFEGGLALSPRLSNLAVYQFGGSYSLLEIPVDDEALILRAFGSWYRKDAAAGPISHTGATLVSDDVGRAVDLMLGWKPSHDVVFSMSVGRFYPGDAFPTNLRDPATVVQTGLTYGF